MVRASDDEELLDPLSAAHRLGITSELLFQYTKRGFAKASGLRSLKTLERSGRTHFSISELDAFDALLAGPWPSITTRRAPIPKAIVDHLRAESLNQCTRCGSGIGVDTAHIRSWAESQSHHHANLIRICTACHREHDAQHSLPPEELVSLKNRAIERTRASLKARMGHTHHLKSRPRPTTNFVGRENELPSLIDALRSGRSVLITGVGGIGKTELLVQALCGFEAGRPIFWIDVEQHRSASDVLAALQTALGTEGFACPEAALPSRLDALQACVVFDGIECAGLDDIDDFEDAIAALYSATAIAQFVATSQIALHKLPADTRLNVGKLDKRSSRQMLEKFASGDAEVEQTDLCLLLEFCEGHALTLRLATALMNHYGGPATALRAINATGVGAVSLPGRKRHSRTTSLDLCLQTAYEALSVEGRQLLWALAESPAGVFAHSLVGGWSVIPNPIEALAELRRWHLVDLIPFRDDLRRTHVLSPIRAFATKRAKKDERPLYEAVLDRLVDSQGVMVAVLELKYDDPNDTPYVIQRYGHELANLLHILHLARSNQTKTRMLMTAVSVAKSLMRYFFVLGLTEQGAKVMHDAADLALSAGFLKRASGLIMQLLALAGRAHRWDLANAGLALAERLERLSEDGQIRADIAMCRGMAARDAGDHAGAESYARQALDGYRALALATDRQSSDPRGGEVGPFEQQDLHNDVSSALSLLGFSLLSLGHYEEAMKAYRHSLQHERGASIAVNRGQILHQIGNCESHLGRFRDAVGSYYEAAKIFYFVSMEEYLSNAFGEIGYALLDINENYVIEDLELEFVEAGLSDLARDTRRVFDSDQPLDHNRCIYIIRKLFGSITFLSLTGNGRLLDEFGVALRNDIVATLSSQVSNGDRAKGEFFPLLMIDTALQLGLLVAEAEHALEEYGDISRDTIGKMLRTVCNTHDWAQNTMRVVDWFAAVLTHRWGFQGATPARLREFIANFNDDVVDYFDLTRGGSNE